MRVDADKGTAAGFGAADTSKEVYVVQVIGVLVGDTTRLEAL
jgi:hypothetical protein